MWCLCSLVKAPANNGCTSEAVATGNTELKKATGDIDESNVPTLLQKTDAVVEGSQPLFPGDVLPELFVQLCLRVHWD